MFHPIFFKKKEEKLNERREKEKKKKKNLHPSCPSKKTFVNRD